DGDVTAVTNARDEVQEARLELLAASPAARITRCGFRIGASLPRPQRRVGANRAVLDAMTGVGKGIIALAVVLLHAREVLVRRLDEIAARHALGRRHGRQELLARLAGRLERAHGRIALLTRALPARDERLDLRDLVV